MALHKKEKGGTDTPSVLIKMAPERMIFDTDNSGMYSYVESCLNEENTIANLLEVMSISIEAEGVEDDEVLLRVWVTEYTTE